MVLEHLLTPTNPILWITIIGILAGTGAVLARPFSTYLKFVYPNAKFEAMGNPFIYQKNLDTLLQNKTLTSTLETINTYKDYHLSSETAHDLQHQLDQHFFETIEMMRKDSSPKLAAFYDAYLFKYDSPLIKKALQQLLFHDKTPEGLRDNALLKKTKDLLRDLQTSEPEHITSVLQAYSFPNDLIEKINEKEIDTQLLNTKIDQTMLKSLQNTKVPYKCEPGKQQLVGILRDIRNIKNLLRSKHLSYEKDITSSLFIGEGKEIAPWKYNELTEVDSVSQIISGLEGTSYYEPLKNNIEDYHKEHSVQYLEIALDSYSLEIIKNLSQQYYVTIGPTIRFLLSKEYEIQNLKAIIKGISENLPSERIQRLLIIQGATS